MSNHPNRAHTEAQAMSFEQQVAQVLDSMTKELTMSEPPAGPLGAANQYAEPPRRPSSLATTMIPALGLTFREAADRVTDLLARAEASHERDEDDEGPAAAERIGWQGEADRLHDAILAAPPVTVADLSVKLERLTCPIFGVAALVHPNHLQNLAEDVRRMVATVPDYRGMPTTTIPEIGITFSEAAERYRSLRRAEMEANQRGDQGAADDANRHHCKLADQIMDAAPSTPADAMVILSMLADREMGIAAGIDDERAQRALERVYGLLSAAGQPLSQTKASELSAMVCRWLELRDIASPSKRQAAELDRLADRIAAYQPHSTADAMAHLGFVLAYYMGDSTFDLESDDSSYARALQKGLAYFANAGDPAAGTLYRLGSIGLTNARAFWVNPEAGGEVARLEHREAEAFRGEADDDAELLDLWRRYLPLKAEAERIDEAGDLEGWMRAHEPCNALEKRMATVPARTPTGIAVKLAVLWQWGGAVVDRRGPTNERENGPDRLSDHMVQWLWMVMNEARALGAPMPLLPNDVTTDVAAAAEDSRRLVLEIESEAPADPFGEAVAEIAGSAPDTLSMPLELTDRMIDAGASAAGITPEQFKAAVIAARDARAA